MRELDFRLKLLLSFLCGLAVAGFCFTLFSISQNKRPSVSVTPTPTSLPSTKWPTPTPLEIPDEPLCLGLQGLSEGWGAFFVSDDFHCQGEYSNVFYFAPGQELKVPSLMSDYSFVAIFNNNLDKYYFSKTSYTVVVSFENEQLTGNFYNDGKRSVWLQAKLNDETLKDFHQRTQVIAHAGSKEEIENVLEQMTVTAYRYTFSPSIFEIPPRVTFAPNTLDPSGKYRYYLPPGYTRQPKEPGLDWSTWKKSSGETLCLTLEGVDGEPCQFSTSGCTCCNTGCEYLDWVLYMTHSGSLEVAELLQKGGGAVENMGPRFVYDANDHPWVYWSASFSADKNELAKNVLELFHMVESIERTY